MAATTSPLQRLIGGRDTLVAFGSLLGFLVLTMVISLLIVSVHTPLGKGVYLLGAVLFGLISLPLAVLPLDAVPPRYQAAIFYGVFVGWCFVLSSGSVRVYRSVRKIL